RKKWIERQKQWLKQNRAGQVLPTLKKHLEPAGVANENAPVRKCWRYLKNRRDQLDYEGALEKGLPIGSGETESAHRHLIQRRLKLPGAWWKRETASDMAQLRVTRANGNWKDFWSNKAA
ncbi:MAG: ISKra4 family transposase, partial [Verrucomicrobiales bacterium]|nr:ISKra4 family transposase [Verrucomicrobiales bacterium]